MTEPRSEGGLVRYCCTAGNGMEPLLADEVKRKLAAEDVCQMPGKVLFSSSAGIARVSQLKAAERLFLLLKHDSPVRFSAHSSPAKAASVLQSRLLDDRNQWTSAVLTWSRLQGELSDRRTSVNISNAARVMKRNEEGRGSEEQREEEEKCNVEPGESKGEQREEERGNRRLRSGEENGARALEKKRKRETAQKGENMSRETNGVEAQALEKKIKRDDEEESSCDKSAEKQRTSERAPKRDDKDDDEEERRMVMEFSSCRQNVKRGIISETGLHGRAATAIDHNVESSSRDIDDKAKGCAVENMEHVKTTEGEEMTLLQPSRIKPQITSSVPVSFRINCKCTGSVSRYFSTQEVSKVIGVGLGRLLGWKADLKNPQLEVNVYLSDDHCLLGIPLTRLPLANRSYIKTTGVRSTIAWAMASLAEIQPGVCVVDPMCGVGTILIEAAQEHKAACFLGMDIDDRQLQKANENIEFAELGNKIHLLKSSSMVLPLPSASVDAVVCDLPFGRKFGTKTDMAANLPVIVTEMERVLCVGGTLVLLLSPQLSCLLKKVLAEKDTGPTSNQETKPQTGIQANQLPSPSSRKQQAFQIHSGLKSSPTQETDTQSGLQHSLPQPLCSLKLQATLRVSLGAIDGLIHKYVKIDA
ncbi:THUMP domain-containing protein 2 isoform X2 [Toxotes jaculatrix]|uniref:THUMP domain-containing protein 2 isoform X2 n=1 Tax=Toxotes jaculatrix TaxID=941984 RepID=UPI001B3A7FDA|nr:THUMP domain-containing protein 2 isoform X2 [Toxotes jaculatrix]